MMVKKKTRTLLTDDTKKSIFLHWIRDPAIQFAYAPAYFWFGRHSPLRLLYKLRLISIQQVFGYKCKQKIRKFDKIIFSDFTNRVLLRQPAFARSKKNNTFFYLWNPVGLPTKVDLTDLPHKIYSFDPKDCETYHLKFNTQFYVQPPAEFFRPREILYDLVFLGAPKDRLACVRSIYEDCKKQDLRLRIYVIAPCADAAVTEDGWQAGLEYFGYDTYITDFVLPARAILDVYQTGQTGYSLRVMEHLFFGKKLVTNNPVIRDAEFYHPENIFILGDRDIGELKPWLDVPFVPIPDEVRDYYEIHNWLERFV